MDREYRELERAARLGDAVAAGRLGRLKDVRDVWPVVSEMEAAIAWITPRYDMVPGLLNPFRSTISQCLDCLEHPVNCFCPAGGRPFTWELEPGWRQYMGESVGGRYIPQQILQGPTARSKNLLEEIAAARFGMLSGNIWPKDAQGEMWLDGVRFVLLPSNNNSHRFKIQCPGCAKMFGANAGKFGQHADRCKGNK